MTGELPPRCHRPPVPWRCSREHDHNGPCVATRNLDVGEKPIHIECRSYTDLQPAFNLYKEQRQVIGSWMQDHDKSKHVKPGETHRYAGAIGGTYTFGFTNTSLGIVVTVQCACGEKIDVSNYSEW